MTAFQRRYYPGAAAATNLALGIGVDDESFAILDDSDWPGSPGADFVVVIDIDTDDEEKILCSSNSGTTVAVAERGFDGTEATAHNANATVNCCWSAVDADEANQVTNLLGNGAEGDVLIGGGEATLPTWGYPALTSVTGSNQSNVTLAAAGNTTVADVGSLDVGTWDITFGMTYVTPADTGVIELYVVEGSATAGFEGQAAAEDTISSSNEGVVQTLNLAFTAVITVAGTLEFVVHNSCSDTGSALKETSVSSVVNATGYRATRIQ